MNKEDLDFRDAQMLRKIAEKKIKEKQKASEKPIVETDVKKLMHELQVHQIELEMQNEELKQAYETSETALKKYTMLYDCSPTGYFTLDIDGSILDLNFTGAELLGEKRFSLINSNFKLFVSDESKPVFSSFFKSIFTTHSKQSCELKLGYDKRDLCYAYVEGIIIEEEQKCLLSVMDISSYKTQ